MTNICPQYEINNPTPGGILFCPRDPGTTEMRLGRPLVGRAGTQVFDPCLREAGIRREDINICNVVGVQPPSDNFARHSEVSIREGIAVLERWIERLQPALIVAMGNEAAFALIDNWPTKKDSGRIQDATGILDRRGYFWEGRHGHKVLATIHPAYPIHGDNPKRKTMNWVPWYWLLGYDFARAREDFEQNGTELVRPEREVVIV